MTVGQRIKEIREARGLSAQKLADAVGITRPSISMMESGKRDGKLSTIEKIAGVLEVSMSDLFQPVGSDYGTDGKDAPLRADSTIIIEAEPGTFIKLEVVGVVTRVTRD